MADRVTMAIPEWQQAARERETVAAQARALPPEPMSGWVRAVVAAAALAWLGVLVWQALTLPDRVPQHWNGPTPDRWASKPEALLFGAVFPLAVGLPMTFASRLALSCPEALSMPYKDWWTATPERVVRFERLLREDLWRLLAGLLTVVTACNVDIGIAAHRPGGRIDDPYLDLAVGGLVALLLGYVVWLPLRRYRPVPPEKTRPR